MLFIKILLIAILAAGAVFSIYYMVKHSKENKKVVPVGLALAGLSLIIMIILPFSLHIVDTGEIAVVKYFGEARDTRSPGIHFDFWVTNTYQRYDTKVQNIEIKTAAYSADAQTMDVEMTLQYQIASNKAIDISKQYGSLEVLQSRIQSVAIEKTKAVLSGSKAMNIIANRAAMSPAVEESIMDAIGSEYYCDVTTVVLTNIDFSDAFETAVEEKMIAEQKKLKAEYENETKIATAEANAKANELMEASLSDNILRKMYLEKWDGHLPSVVAGEDATIMIPSAANTANEAQK